MFSDKQGKATASAPRSGPPVRRIPVQGYDVDLRSYGAGAGQPGQQYVLIHGIGVSARYFEPLARELADGAAVHTLDMPGFGATPKPRRQLSMADFARINWQALDAAGIDQAVLVGHSMGCQVAVEMALQEPGRTDALVLLGPTINRRERSGPVQAFRLLQDTLRESWSANAIVFSDYLRAGPRWYLRTMPEMLGHRLEERIAGVTVPTLLVRGGRDPIVPADWLRLLARACPGARAVDIPGQPHVVMYSRPAQTAAYCRDMAPRP